MTLGGLEALGFGIHNASNVLRFLPWQIAVVLPGLCAVALVFVVRMDLTMKPIANNSRLPNPEIERFDPDVLRPS